jgi:hypothetical protein
MGKVKKEHRKKVEARNEKIKQQMKNIHKTTSKLFKEWKESKSGSTPTDVKITFDES